MLNYGRVTDYLCLEQCGQREAAEQRMKELRDSGRLSLSSLKVLNSSEMCTILQGLRMDTVRQLRAAAAALEYIDTLQLLSETRSTIVSASIDDIISAALKSGYMKKPSDWAAVVMLAHDLCKPITSTTLCNALSSNAEAVNFGLPSRQSLDNAYIPHTRKSVFPNWKCKSQKEQRYFRIAETIYNLLSVL